MSIGALQNFIRTWRQQPTLQVSTLSVLIGSFTILAIALLVHQNLEHALTQWGREVKVNVYLNEANDQAKNADIKQHIESSGFFSKIDYLSKADAMTKFKTRVNEFAPGLLADLEADNPLPASFEMTIDGGVKNNSQFQHLVDWATKMKTVVGIDEVSYGQGWIENYASVLKVFSVTSLIFIFVILSGSLFVIGNSIRSAISQRRDEIEILELFGATRGLILWPYVFEGLVLGFMASILSIVVTYVLYVWQTDLMMRELAFWNFQTHVDFLNFARIFLIVVTGTGLGGLGSFLWARKVCTGWSAAEASSKWSD
jgi:cell division transport system permease protein